MTQRPEPRPLSDEALSHLLAGQQFGTLLLEVDRLYGTALDIEG